MTVACQDSLSLPISWSLPKFMSIASVILSSILILWCSTLLLPPIFPSIRDFSNESAVHIRWENTGVSVSASPTPVFLPGESQGRRAWWAAVYGVAQSQIRLKRLSSSSIEVKIFLRRCDFFINFILFLNLKHCISFAKHQNESATGIQGVINTLMLFLSDNS